MLTRAQIDPELHTLRSLIARTDGRERQQLESARFAIYAAYEGRDSDSARRWCVAMRAGLLAARLDLADGELIADIEPRLLDAKAPWGIHWIRGGWNGTEQLAQTLLPLDRVPGTLIDRLDALAKSQRESADESEREWQLAVEELLNRRGQMLSAATVEERKEVADRIAKAATRLVCWGATR